jgi:hypothetical protein
VEVIPARPNKPTKEYQMENSNLAVTYLTPNEMTEDCEIKLKSILQEHYLTNRVLIIYDSHVNNTQLIITEL